MFFDRLEAKVAWSSSWLRWVSSVRLGDRESTIASASGSDKWVECGLFLRESMMRRSRLPNISMVSSGMVLTSGK
jgi:hypothetical protein